MAAVMLRRQMGRGSIRAVVAALAASALAPAGASAAHERDGRAFFYEVTYARISYTVEYSGAGAAGCAERGVCDVSGTASYRLPRSQFGFAFLAYSRPSLAAGGEIALFGRGRTKVTAGAATDATPCTDTRREDFDFLTLSGRRGTVRARLHPYDREEGTPDYLDTVCGGPDDSTLAKARAVPTATFSLRRFRRRLVRLVDTGERSFEADGFRGTVRHRMRLVLRRSAAGPERDASPNLTG